MSDLSLEEIERRIAQLKGKVPSKIRVPVDDEEEDRPAAPPREPFDFDAWIAEQVQPDNEPDEPFVVGEHFNRYGEQEALPPYRWPDPNGPMTEEAYTAHDREQRLRMDAAQELAACVRHVAGRLRYGNDFWMDRYQGPPCELFEKRWAYLTGLWRARVITPPSEEMLQQWASESPRVRRDAQKQST